MASFPTSVKSWTALVDASDYPQAAHLNEARDEINAIEAGYLNGTARLNSSNSTVANLSVSGGSTVVGAGSFGTIVVTSTLISPGTADGSDTKSITLAGGGAVGTGRGASLLVAGLDHATKPGKFELEGDYGYIITTGAATTLQLGTNNTVRMTINANGTQTWAPYGAGTATFDSSGNITSVSDRRFKDRIRPLPYGLAEVLKLKPIQHGYNKRSGLERKHLYGGFIVQDVRKAGMLLAVGRDARGYLTLSDRPILGATVNAVKELHARLAAVEATIAA